MDDPGDVSIRVRNAPEAGKLQLQITADPDKPPIVLTVDEREAEKAFVALSNTSLYSQGHVHSETTGVKKYRLYIEVIAEVQMDIAAGGT